MTTLDDTIDTIAKADEKEEKPEKENPFEKKADDEDKKDDKDETNKAILEAIKGLTESIKAHNEKIDKAMETPTDLPQAPKGNADSEDIGDKVTTPKDPYPQGDQSGIQDANGKVVDKPESDKGDLKMQEKAVYSHVTSPVERPTGHGQSDVAKSQGKEDLISYQVLQKCRSKGYENLSLVGKELMGLAENYDKEGSLEW
jgi:hypothetical protein